MKIKVQSYKEKAEEMNRGGPVSDITEDECVAIMTPIITQASRIFNPETMMKLTFGCKEESKHQKFPNRFTADFWRAVEKKYLKFED